MCCISEIVASLAIPEIATRTVQKAGVSNAVKYVAAAIALYHARRPRIFRSHFETWSTA